MDRTPPGILHRIGVGDEWLQIQFTVSHEVNGLLIHIGITEDIFDAHLGSLQFRNVDSHRTDRMPTITAAPPSNQPPECLGDFGEPEHSKATSAPPQPPCFLTDALHQILFGEIHRNNTWNLSRNRQFDCRHIRNQHLLKHHLLTRTTRSRCRLCPRSGDHRHRPA